MNLINRLIPLEDQYLFVRWAMGAEYGKLRCVGMDYIEFDIVDIDTMEFQETVLIHNKLILEVYIGGADIGRIVAEMSSQLEC